jgi:hypothetical protein
MAGGSPAANRRRWTTPEGIRIREPVNPMWDVDMSGVFFDFCAFRGIDFTRVELSDDPDFILLTDKAFLDRATVAIPVDGSVSSRVIFGLFDDYRKQMSMAPSGSTLANLRDLKPRWTWRRAAFNMPDGRRPDDSHRPPTSITAKGGRRERPA